MVDHNHGEPLETTVDPARKQCLEIGFNSFGTAKIFERRAVKLKRKLNILTFLGIGTPVTVGAFVLSFGSANAFLNYAVLPLAGIVALAQCILSIWSLVARWEDEYAHSLSSVPANMRLHGRSVELNAQDLQSEGKSEWGKALEVLLAESRRQDDVDLVQHISEKERRYGMRCSLYHFKKKCASCKRVPLGMSPTNCDTCGNF